jgi:predicted RNase H-like HicB family nuclease
MKKIDMIVEKTNTGYSAFADQYPVCTTGNDLTELRYNILEALNLYFEVAENGRMIEETDYRIILDLPQFFDFYKVINAKAFSQRIGMNQSLLAQYIKGKKKPSAAQAKRILQGVQHLGRELSEISF